MDRFQYLILLGGCLVLTLPLEFFFRARVWRRPRRLWQALWPVVLVFGVWDVWAIQRGHWTFSRRLTTGVKLPFDFPVDELAFFVAVPICGLLTFEAVRNILERSTAREKDSS
jgi:lycopene cyclase domain-containing protein